MYNLRSRLVGRIKFIPEKTFSSTSFVNEAAKKIHFVYLFKTASRVGRSKTCRGIIEFHLHIIHIHLIEKNVSVNGFSV